MEGIPVSFVKEKTVFFTLGFQCVRGQGFKSEVYILRMQPAMQSNGRYVFAYRIRIANNSQQPVQLLRRHWIITDATGKTENIWSVSPCAHSLYTLRFRMIQYSFKGLRSVVCQNFCSSFAGRWCNRKQPVILPKTGFEYSSACPLISTPNGRMVSLNSVPQQLPVSCEERLQIS